MCIASYMHSYYMLQPLRMMFHYESNRYVANYVPESICMEMYLLHG